MSKLVKYNKVCLNQPYCVHEKEEEPPEATAKLEETSKEAATKIIENANRSAAKIIENAETKSKEIYKNAFDDGYLDGYKKGREKADREAKEALDNIKELFIKIDGKKEEMIKDNEKNILRIAIKIAERITDKALMEDDEVFIKMFANAVEGIFGQKWVKLTVSGYEASFATASSAYLLGMVKDAEQIEICVNKNAPRGTCIVETESSIVDASASTQIKSMEKALLGV